VIQKLTCSQVCGAGPEGRVSPTPTPKTCSGSGYLVGPLTGRRHIGPDRRNPVAFPKHDPISCCQCRGDHRAVRPIPAGKSAPAGASDCHTVFQGRSRHLCHRVAWPSAPLRPGSNPSANGCSLLPVGGHCGGSNSTSGEPLLERLALHDGAGAWLQRVVTQCGFSVRWSRRLATRSVAQLRPTAMPQ